MAPFWLNVTATSAVNSCGASGSNVVSTAFSTLQNPTLMRTSPATSTLCSTQPNVTLAYSLSGTVAGSQFNLLPTTTNTSVICTATPSNTSKLNYARCATMQCTNVTRAHEHHFFDCVVHTPEISYSIPQVPI